MMCVQNCAVVVLQLPALPRTELTGSQMEGVLDAATAHRIIKNKSPK